MHVAQLRLELGHEHSFPRLHVVGNRWQVLSTWLVGDVDGLREPFPVLDWLLDMDVFSYVGLGVVLGHTDLAVYCMHLHLRVIRLSPRLEVLELVQLGEVLLISLVQSSLLAKRLHRAMPVAGGVQSLGLPLVVSEGLLLVNLAEPGDESFVATTPLGRAILRHSVQLWKLVDLVLPVSRLHFAMPTRLFLVEERLVGARFVLRNVQGGHRWWILCSERLLVAIPGQSDGALASGVREHALFVIPSDRMASSLEGLQSRLRVHRAHQLIRFVSLLLLSCLSATSFFIPQRLLVDQPILTLPMRVQGHRRVGLASPGVVLHQDAVDLISQLIRYCIDPDFLVAYELSSAGDVHLLRYKLLGDQLLA